MSNATHLRIAAWGKPPACESCKGPILDKKRGTRFCSDSCRRLIWETARMVRLGAYRKARRRDETVSE